MFEEDAKTGLKRVDKKTLITFIGLAIVIIVLLFIPRFMSGEENHQFEDDGVVKEDTQDGTVYVAFENEYQLDYSIGKKTAGRILSRVGNIIANTVDYYESAAQLTGVIVETSLKKDVVESGYSYSFEVDVSNGEKYQVWARTGGLYGYVYDCSLVRRLNPERYVGDLDIVLELVNAGEANREQVIMDLKDWAQARLHGLDAVMNVTDIEQ